ncbi:hypothetical protein K443DRAFT_394271 [Laccaria amethystina LaAM-08-1]|uniref:Uncharacterized protein n=1 Tax=Laccaria amethystina LaAM-08-1 TaxID=1095629 RepID=A0A0C9XXG1_9AGAR|nr:hypothetical protein K443DRAFT_394271 [Laccaria amethystina LaAM-08-1]
MKEKRKWQGATRKWSEETANVAIVRWKAYMRLPSHRPQSPIQRKNSLSPSTVIPDENTPLQSERIYDGLCQAARGIYQLPKR